MKLVNNQRILKSTPNTQHHYSEISLNTKLKIIINRRLKKSFINGIFENKKQKNQYTQSIYFYFLGLDKGSSPAAGTIRFKIKKGST